MKKFISTGLILASIGGMHSAYAQSDELAQALQKVRENCGGISESLNKMKTMAGINTAVTGVGTVSAGVALGTGIAKADVDKEYDELLEQLNSDLDKISEKQREDMLHIDLVEADQATIIATIKQAVADEAEREKIIAQLEEFI